MRRDGRSVAADAALGALAGAAATWTMDRVTTYLYANEGRRARRREEAARRGRTAYGAAAEKAAGLVGRELTREQRESYGSAMHWGLGVGAGATYGVLRGRVPAIDRAQGTAFGAAFWLLVDESANPALGLTPGPRAFPWQAHARGLAGHLVFGAVVNGVLRMADRLG